MIVLAKRMMKTISNTGITKMFIKNESKLKSWPNDAKNGIIPSSADIETASAEAKYFGVNFEKSFVKGVVSRKITPTQEKLIKKPTSKAYSGQIKSKINPAIASDVSLSYSLPKIGARVRMIPIILALKTEGVKLQM